MSTPSFSPTSRRDVNSIFDHIARDNPQAALDAVRKIEEKCRLLAKSPDIGSARDDLSPDLLASAVGSYVIVYRVLNGGIDIVRVVHGSRDFSSLFS